MGNQPKKNSGKDLKAPKGRLQLGTSCTTPKKKPKNNPVYSADQHVLVLGDGDFSFSRALAKRIGAGDKVVATSLDCRKTVVEKYGASATSCMKACKTARVTVQHGIDAGQLHLQFGARSFDRIVFNFPHTGKHTVDSNRTMLRGLFKQLLKLQGELHITLKLVPPYIQWKIESLAEEAGYIEMCRMEGPFKSDKFPGYTHRTTLASAGPFDVLSKEALEKTKTLVFCTWGCSPETCQGSVSESSCQDSEEDSSTGGVSESSCLDSEEEGSAGSVRESSCQQQSSLEEDQRQSSSEEEEDSEACT